MIDPDTPETKQVGVLAGEALGETGGRGDFEIVQDDDRAVGAMMQRQEKSVLALGGIRRTVDQNQSRLHEALERFPLRGDVERRDRTQAIPAAR